MSKPHEVQSDAPCEKRRAARVFFENCGGNEIVHVG